MKITYVNILWIFFSIAGLVVLGIVPSTVALYGVIRKWVMKETEVPVFKTFFNIYKTEFVKSNVLGILMGIIGYVLFFNLVYIIDIRSTAQLIISVPLFIGSVFYLVTLLYLVPVYVHYDLKLFQYIKHAFYIGIANPLSTVMMLFGSLLVSLFFYLVPGILPFAFPTLFAIVVMWGGFRSFQKIEAKQKGVEFIY